MSPIATQETNDNVEAYINSIGNEAKIKDAFSLLSVMEEITGSKAKLWGNNGIIGFGKTSYTRKGSKEEIPWFKVGFAARKTKISVYLTCDISQYQEILEELGKHKTGKGCLYINKLADIEMSVLEKLIKTSLQQS